MEPTRIIAPTWRLAETHSAVRRKVGMEPGQSTVRAACRNEIEDCSSEVNHQARTAPRASMIPEAYATDCSEPRLIRNGARKAVPMAEPMPPATEMMADTTATWAAVATRAVAALTAGVTIWPR